MRLTAKVRRFAGGPAAEPSPCAAPQGLGLPRLAALLGAGGFGASGGFGAGDVGAGDARWALCGQGFGIFVERNGIQALWGGLIAFFMFDLALEVIEVIEVATTTPCAAPP